MSNELLTAAEVAATATEVAKTSMLSTAVNTAAEFVKRNPVAVGAVVAAAATTALCVYGHKKWGWFSSEENQQPQIDLNQLSQEQLRQFNEQTALAIQQFNTASMQQGQ